MHLVFARTFDTYESDRELQRFFQIGGISENAIVLATSFDEASKSLTKESKEYWSTLGSTMLDKLEFRDNFAMIGQRGLSHGTAIEQVLNKVNKMLTVYNLMLKVTKYSIFRSKKETLKQESTEMSLL